MKPYTHSVCTTHLSPIHDHLLQGCFGEFERRQIQTYGHQLCMNADGRCSCCKRKKQNSRAPQRSQRSKDEGLAVFLQFSITSSPSAGFQYGQLPLFWPEHLPQRLKRVQADQFEYQFPWLPRCLVRHSVQRVRGFRRRHKCQPHIWLPHLRRFVRFPLMECLWSRVQRSPPRQLQWPPEL